MFLIEGKHKSVLYTGDIRAEKWWVESIKRHPLLLRYVATVKDTCHRLDAIYLDTTFVDGGLGDPYRHFPSKADGITELLREVARYPRGTLFYFDSWTFGYEDVWQVLCASVGAQFHVDDYRHGLYRALANGPEPKAPEALPLMGFYRGNHFQPGCLTSSAQTQLHSCEEGTGCEIWQKDFVRITPIITRHQGVEMVELGAGGGYGDLNQQQQLEIPDQATLEKLKEFCVSKLQGQDEVLCSVLRMLSDLIAGELAPTRLDQIHSIFRDEAMQDVAEQAGLGLSKFVLQLAQVACETDQQASQPGQQDGLDTALPHQRRADGLPRRITFPYSRHSSYEELCLLIDAFKPRDIYPCTVNETTWQPSRSMQHLFGHLYSDLPSFRHDQEMLRRRREETDAINAVRAARLNTTGEAQPRGALASRGGSGLGCGKMESGTGQTGASRADDANAASKRKHWPSSGPLEGRSAGRKHNKSDEELPHRMTTATSSSTKDQGGASDKAAAPLLPPCSTNHKLLHPNRRPSQSRPRKAESIAPSLGEDRAPGGDVSPSSRARWAFRKEVEAAVLGIGGASWSQIGLVSTRTGAKEEEL